MSISPRNGRSFQQHTGGSVARSWSEKRQQRDSVGILEGFPARRTHDRRVLPAALGNWAATVFFFFFSPLASAAASSRKDGCFSEGVSRGQLKRESRQIQRKGQKRVG